MRKAIVPNIDGITVFDDVVDAKHLPNKVVLRAIRASILDAYEKYLAAAPNVENLNLNKASNAQKKSLLHAYNTSTLPLELMRTQLTEPILNTKCFLCSISEVASLDHYLPKELFPQFSIFPQNLVPSCTKCNSHKGTKLIDEKVNVRRFLHSYYDDIPDESFLKANLEIKADLMVLKFHLAKPAGMAKYTFLHLQSHFNELGLAKRYMTNGLLHLREKRASYQRIYEPDNDALSLSERLAEEAQDFIDDYGANYWLAVLYKTLSTHTQFCAGGFSVLDRIQ